MLPRMRRMVALTAFLLIACLTAPARASQAQPRADAPLVLTGLGRATVPLDGPWQFQPGDDLRWASPQFDDSGWANIEVGKTWEEQGYRNLTGFAWYRRHIVLGPGASAIAIYLHSTFNPACDSACEVYWNGVLVGGIGKVPPDPVWNFSRAEPSAVVELGTAQSGVLAIRVWKAPIVFLSFPNEGGLATIPQAGTGEAVAALQAADEYRWLKGDQFTISVARVSAIGGLLALLFWLRDRQRTVLIWLALVMFDLLEMFYIAFMPFRVFYGLIGIAIGINDMALWLLLIAFLGLSNRTRLVRWTWIFIAAEIALDSVDGIIQLFNLYPRFPHACLIADAASTIPAVALEFWGIVLVAAAFRERLDAARWTLAVFALLTDLLQAVADIVTLGLRWTHWTTPGWVHTPLVTLGSSGLDIRTIISTCMLLSIIYVAWRYSVEQTERQVELEQEFRNARELQQFLIPAALPETPGFAISSAYRPAREVGGDFFQILPLDGELDADRARRRERQRAEGRHGRLAHCGHVARARRGSFGAGRFAGAVESTPHRPPPRRVRHVRSIAHRLRRPMHSGQRRPSRALAERTRAQLCPGRFHWASPPRPNTKTSNLRLRPATIWLSILTACSRPAVHQASCTASNASDRSLPPDPAPRRPPKPQSASARTTTSPCLP